MNLFFSWIKVYVETSKLTPLKVILHFLFALNWKQIVKIANSSSGDVPMKKELTDLFKPLRLNLTFAILAFWNEFERFQWKRRTKTIFTHFSQVHILHPTFVVEFALLLSLSKVDPIVQANNFASLNFRQENVLESRWSLFCIFVPRIEAKPNSFDEIVLLFGIVWYCAFALKKIHCETESGGKLFEKNYGINGCVWVSEGVNEWVNKVLPHKFNLMNTSIGCRLKNAKILMKRLFTTLSSRGVIRILKGEGGWFSIPPLIP